MRQKIGKAAVLGAGVMGSAIAAHLANAGIPSFLLDIVPPELTEAEKKKGLTFQSPEVRNRFAVMGKKRVQESRPASLYLKDDAELLTVGNFEDHLSWISDVDWVIEVVVEDLNLKRELFRKLIPFLKEGTIVSSNTSGISVQKMCEGFPADFAKRFLGTHFFNPPRYMKLLEIIPIPATSNDVVETMAYVGERILGKGIVYAKDTPNFIGNRIGAFSGAMTMRTMIEDGYRIEEVDQITGPAMGRPKMGTFKLGDLVGLDIMAHVSKNLYESLPAGKEKDYFAPSPFIQQMIKNQWLGQKTKQGFYKKVKKEGKEETLVLDYEKLDYRPQQKANFPSVDMGKNIDDVRERIKTLVYSVDRGGQFAWKVLKKTMLYSAEKIPEISDDIINIDRAMKWGYNWELGPFEIWDAIGLKSSVKKMEKEGEAIPPLVEKVLSKGPSFYEKKEGSILYFDLGAGQYQQIEAKPEIILLPSLKDRNKTVLSNAGASLIDIGDGVACLEFHSKMNTIGADTILMMRDSLTQVREKFEGLVIGNQAENFSAGANLMLVLFEIQDENWDTIEDGVKALQDTLMAIKYFEKPVVAAPFGLTLGGGCEVCLHSSRVQAAAETYIGFVEVGVGLVPAGGGTKEMLLRCTEGIPPGVVDVELLPFVRKAFENVAMAKVATSAKEAQQLGLMRMTDKVTINRDFLIHDAKQAVLDLVREGYRPPRPPKSIKVMGERGYALLQMFVFGMREGGYISEYDGHIGKKVGRILTGGDLPDGTEVTEQYLLDLEREAFVSLCGERKTQERIEYMLKRGKPLRN